MGSLLSKRAARFSFRCSIVMGTIATEINRITELIESDHQPEQALVPRVPVY